MDRKLLVLLADWYQQVDRKPLIIRGARQVGKTWLVRQLAAHLDKNLLEVNFERTPNLQALFSDNDPFKTLRQLEIFFNKDIDPISNILFLDEIQVAPALLAKLRWFAEEMPELAVIATGSLLDFALEDHEFSMPVGRISYMYLEPMSFEEFLRAQNQHKLCEFLEGYSLQDKISEHVHLRLLESLREYLFVGGMPAAVQNWIVNKSLLKVGAIHQDILSTYRDDFAKYAKRVQHESLEEVLGAIPRMLGRKFKYSAINYDIRSELLKQALNLLCKARIAHKVVSCAANGVPIAAEVREKVFKVIMLDVGLATSAMGLMFPEKVPIKDLSIVNEGSIAEQFVGQMLRTINPYYMDPKLYYWVRDKLGSAAEVDYIIQHEAQIVPIEVKAGSTGALRSLHAFMKLKDLDAAVRLNADFPSIMDVQVKDHAGNDIMYKLISLPLYLSEQLHRLLEDIV